MKFLLYIERKCETLTFKTLKVHNKSALTDIIAPALSNSPQ